MSSSACAANAVGACAVVDDAFLAHSDGADGTLQRGELRLEAFAMDSSGFESCPFHVCRSALGLPTCVAVGSVKLVPTIDEQHCASDPKHRRDGQGETPPINGACRKDPDGEARAAAMASPQPPTSDTLDEAHDEEAGEQRHRRPDVVGLERSLAVSRESHHDRNVLADPDTRDRRDCENAEPDGLDPSQRRGSWDSAWPGAS